MNFDKLAKQIHAQNVAAGWWDNPDRCLLECVQLIVTEVAEATEGARKNLMDDHLPHRKMEEVELADALIRTLDLGGKMGLKFERNVAGCMVPRLSSVGEKHLRIVMCAADFAKALLGGDRCRADLRFFYSRIIGSIVSVANLADYDIEDAMMEKIEYNRTRADHTREARAAEHGKAF
jgi:hypothetical protein